MRVKHLRRGEKRSEKRVRLLYKGGIIEEGYSTIFIMLNQT